MLLLYRRNPPLGLRSGGGVGGDDDDDMASIFAVQHDSNTSTSATEFRFSAYKFKFIRKRLTKFSLIMSIQITSVSFLIQKHKQILHNTLIFHVLL